MCPRFVSLPKVRNLCYRVGEYMYECVCMCDFWCKSGDGFKEYNGKGHEISQTFAGSGIVILRDRRSLFDLGYFAPKSNPADLIEIVQCNLYSNLIHQLMIKKSVKMQWKMMMGAAIYLSL